MRGWAADPRVVVGRPEREEGEEGVGEAVEAIAEVALESAPEISGVGGGVGGEEACAEGCAARAWQVSEEGDGEEREDDEDEEEHEHEVPQRGHRQQDLHRDRAGVARRRRQSVLEPRAGVRSKGCRAEVQSRGVHAALHRLDAMLDRPVDEQHEEAAQRPTEAERRGAACGGFDGDGVVREQHNN